MPGAKHKNTDDIRKSLSEKRERLVAEAVARADNPAFKAAEEAQISKALKRFDELATPMAKFDRIVKPMTMLDQNADMLKKVMAVNEFAKPVFTPSLSKAVGASALGTGQTSGMPVRPKGILPEYSKALLGQTATDPLRARITTRIDSASLAASFGGRTDMNKALLSTKKVAFSGLPKKMFAEDFYEKLHAAVASAASKTLDMSLAFPGLPKGALTPNYFEAPKPWMRATTASMLDAKLALPAFAMDPGLSAKMKTIGALDSKVIQTAMRVNSQQLKVLQASAFAQMAGGRSSLDPLHGPLSPLDRNRQLVESAFALTSGSRNYDPFSALRAGLVPDFGFPFVEEEPGRLWTPSEIWTEIQELVEYLLQAAAEQAEPTQAELMAKRLWVAAVIANVGRVEAARYLLWVAAAMPSLAVTTMAAIDNFWLLTPYMLFCALTARPEPSPED